MGKLIMKSMKLENFKGLKSYDIEFSADKTEVFGDNATGKTTLFDAFFWLLTGKDSINQADFEIKPLDENGDVIHGLESSVEVRFDHNGEQVVLKRVFKEKWTKHRGQVKEILTGHETKYYINDVAKPKRDYEKKVEEIAPIELLKLLTNPMFFNDDKAYPWKKRRDLLLEICGDVSDEEVISSDERLSVLMEEIQAGRSIEDVKQIAKARCTKINEEIQQIPVRIDEIQKTMSAVGNDVNRESILSEIAKEKEEKEKIEREIRDIENDVAVAERRNAIAELRNKIIEIKRNHTMAENEAKSGLYDDLDAVNKEMADVKSRIYRCERERDVLVETNEKRSKEKERLIRAWQEEKGKQFVDSVDDVCHYCGQPLPEDRVEEARQRAREEWNKEHSETMSGIEERGFALKAEMEAAEGTIQERVKGIALLNDRKEQLQQRKKEIEKKIEGCTVSYDDSEEKAINEQIEMENQEIVKMQTARREAVSAKQEVVTKISTRISEKEKQIAAIDAAEKANARIDELKKQERTLADEYGRMEKKVYLAETFTKKKVEMLDEKIDSKFRFARFRMFEENVTNDGINEMCVATLQGVPWDSMNNAGRVIVGLDICNTLAKHYDVFLPVWVDNAESVTVLPNMEAQMVALYVDADCKTLKVNKR